MQRASRRTILAGAAGVGTAGLAGYAFLGFRGESLSYTAEVVSQQSESTPATIRTSLTTDVWKTKISAKETIVLYYEEGPGNDLLLFPETDVGPNKPPEEASGGCWRYIDSDFLARDIEEWHTVDSKDGFQETYRLFTRGEDGECLPDGEYRFAATIRDGFRDAVQVVVDVSITDGQVSAEGSVQS